MAYNLEKVFQIICAPYIHKNHLHILATDCVMIVYNKMIIKTRGSESRPRKVELASAHKKNATTTASRRAVASRGQGK